MNELPVYGSKHDGRHLALVTIAELVRRDIKAATGTGLLPARLRATVRSTGLGVAVRVRECPGVVFLSTRRVRADIRGEDPSAKNPIHSPSGVRVIKTIEAIACAYKRPRTSPPSSWDFLVHVEFDPELAKKLRAEIVSAVMNASRAA